MACEHPAKGKGFYSGFPNSALLSWYCFGYLLTGCLCPKETRAPLLTHEVGTAGSYRGALLKAQELILINCKQRGAISGEGSEGMGPKPLSVSWRAASHVQGVVSSGCNLELGLDLYWNYIFTLPVSCGCEL